MDSAQRGAQVLKVILKSTSSNKQADEISFSFFTFPLIHDST